MADQPDPSSEETALREEAAVTRRGFLQTASLASAAALAGCATAGEQAGKGATTRPATQRDRVLGPTGVSLTLEVNGVPRKLTVETRTTLAEALRLQLRLTGTKTPCERGACGGCTVQLDGAAVCSCMTLAIDAAGRKVTTIEGLAQKTANGQLALHPLQQAFIAKDALQCGFCTPGMIMSGKALLERTPAPTPEQIRTAFSGNLCRCGTYPHVFEATAAAAAAATRKNG